MNTNNKSSKNNNFIYALGFICLLNILSSEQMSDERIDKEEEKAELLSEHCYATYFII